MQAAIADFLASSRFAVVGASADQSKFGYKVLKNYINHDKVRDPPSLTHSLSFLPIAVDIPSEDRVRAHACAES